MSEHRAAKMRELGARGGAATKKIAESDPGYYSRIGKLGAAASKGIPRKRAPKFVPAVPAGGLTQLEELYG